MYDTKCYDLAASFLMDSPRSVNTEDHRKHLAQCIQDTIEQQIADWDEEDRLYWEDVRKGEDI